MKILNYLFLVVSLVCAAIGIYNQVEFVPYTELDILSQRDWLYYHDLSMNLGYFALFGGLIGLIGGIFSIIKKHKIGYITIALALVSLIFGLLQATHMFS
ncbi:MAG: hypothetical protein C0596_08190 [Marinilabiliales bacterium]|nr:MAG: hypothetical protein C0596_08190 [Marinilabiliales bacterium]